MNTQKKQLKNMIGYATFGAGGGCLGGILSSFLTMYLTDNALLSMTFITGLMMFGRLSNAITEFLCGFIVDRTHTKLGQARPWILGTAFLCALPVYMVFNIPAGLSETGRMIWATIFYLLHISVFGSIISIANSALLVKITTDSNTRAKFANFSNLISQVSGLAVGAYAVPLLMYFGGYETGYRGMTAVFSVLGFLGMFLTGVLCEEEVDAEKIKEEIASQKKKKFSLTSQIKDAFGNKYALPLLLMYLLYNFAGYVYGSMGTYYIRDILGDLGFMSSISWAKFIPGIIACVIGVVPLANARLGKKKALIMGAVFQTAGFAVIIFDTLISTIIGNALYGVGMAFYGALMGAAIADVADYVSLKKNIDAAGTSSSVAYVGMRIGMLLGSGAVPILLGLGGYSGELANQGLAQSASALAVEKIGYCFIPLACSILLIVISCFMNADEEVKKMRALEKGER